MGLFGVISKGEWCSLSNVRKHLQTLRTGNFDDSLLPTDFNPIGPMKPVSWSDGWIPISDPHSGDHLCLDLDPPSDGQHGQLFDFWIEYVGPWRFVASSFEDFLHKLVKHVLSGHYYWRHDGQLWPMNDESGVEIMIDMFQKAE